MPRGLTHRNVLDRAPATEVTLELLSFAGGENKLGADHELENNEAREINNWESLAVSGMIRSKGLTKVGDGGGSYTEDMDLVIQHFEGTNKEVYGVIEGDLVILSGSDLNQEDAAAFTSGTLCHAVSASNTLFITNATDDIKYKTIGNAIATPTTTPTNACDRIYEHNFRLIAEGDGAKKVYGSMSGTAATWNGAGGWSTANDAWNMTMPDTTQGCVPGFPSGPELTVFTEFDTYVISNQPNVIRRRVINGIGCSAPYSIAKGNEGVFFVSKFPTLGVFLWNGVEFVNLTEKHNFQDDINFSQRIFGIYRDRKYFLFYNESGSGVTYPNRIKIYDTRFGRWSTRPIHADVSNTLGYPALLTRSNNELYVGSSQDDKLYELEDSSTSDDGSDTQASYTTKCFTSRDFDINGGGRFPLDLVRLKLIKAIAVVVGTTGAVGISWSADGGSKTGSITFDLTSTVGAGLGAFVLGTDVLAGSESIKTLVKSFANSAVGTDFEFQINNNDTGTRPEVRRLKIIAIAMEER